MRPEQEQAVDKVIHYFDSYKKENPNKTPHFLWNAKMRFGKTFAFYPAPPPLLGILQKISPVFAKTKK
jgi:hypothetical protein